MNSDLELLREELLDASLIIDSLELTKAYGHLSARIPGSDTMLMTPRRAPGLLSDPDEMIVVDFTGRLLEGLGPVPAEVALHTEIYRARPNVGAVIRTHAKFGNVTSILGRPVHAVHGLGAFLGSEVPVFSRSLMIAGLDAAREVVEALQDADAMLIRGNGAVVVGGSVPEAAVKAIFLEESCELQFLASAAGQPQQLAADEVATWRDAGFDHFEQAWEYFRERLLFDEFEE